MPKTLRELLPQLPSVERKFRSGEFLFHQGDKVRTVHRILKGTVHLVRYHADGSAFILQRARAGAILAEASLFSECYHCDAVTISPTRTLAIKKAVMRSWLAQRPQFAEAWAAYLACEVQTSRQHLEVLSLNTVAARLDAWIASNEGRFPAKGDWKTVATQIGTSPEALYRELAKRRRTDRQDGTNPPR